MRKELTLTAALAVAAPAAAQETVGTMTVTLDAEERTYVIVQGEEEPTSSFRRADGEVLVEIVARPDRTPADDGPMLSLQFAVTGMGPTAEPKESRVVLIPEGEAAMATSGGTSEVSLTSFGMIEGALALSGNFASQLSEDEAAQFATSAVEGDFQATIRQSE